MKPRGRDRQAERGRFRLEKRSADELAGVVEETTRLLNDGDDIDLVYCYAARKVGIAIAWHTRKETTMSETRT